MEARIIKLGPNTSVTRVIDFNEALSDYSQILGLGNKKKQAARRAEKKEAKLQKIADKKEIKAAKQDARASKKVGRVAVRKAGQQARQEKRTAKAAVKQERKTGKMLARQGRKLDRKSFRMERRSMGQEALPPEEEFDETGYEQDYQDDGSGYTEDQGQYPPDENYQDDGGGYYEEESYEDEQYEEDPEMFDENDPFYHQDEEGYEDDEYYDEYNFDGVMNKEDQSSELSDGKSEVKVPNYVQEIANKIAWNEEYIVRLDANKNDVKIKAPDANVDEFETEILKRKNRLSELTGIFDSFLKFEGGFNDDGEFSFYTDDHEAYGLSSADGKPAKRRPRKGAAMNRRKQVRKAMANANEARSKVTIVKTSLNPLIETNRVEVPAADPIGQSSMIGPEASPDAKATGVIGLDQQNDFDSPPALDIKLSSFSGPSLKNVNWTGVFIGVGVASVAIWGLHRMKILK